MEANVLQSQAAILVGEQRVPGDWPDSAGERAIQVCLEQAQVGGSEIGPKANSLQPFQVPDRAFDFCIAPVAGSGSGGERVQADPLLGVAQPAVQHHRFEGWERPVQPQPVPDDAEVAGFAADRDVEPCDAAQVGERSLDLQPAQAIGQDQMHSARHAEIRAAIGEFELRVDRLDRRQRGFGHGLKEAQAAGV